MNAKELREYHKPPEGARACSMPSPTPSAREFFLALIEVRATGEPKKVGTTVIRPDREWPTSSTALWGLALDLERAEREAKAKGVAA